MRRHEILHTVFQLLPGLDLPLQVIVEPYAPPVRVFSAFDECDAALSLLYAEQRASSLVLDQGQMLHTVLVQLGADRQLLLLTLPALCADSVSLINLLRQLSQTYASSSPQSTQEVVQYADYSASQNELGQSAESLPGRKFWKTQPQTAPARLPFEHLDDHSSTDFDPKCVTLTPDDEIIDKLQQHSVNVDLLLLACWQALLWRLTAQSTVGIEAAFDGRRFSYLNEAVGLFRKFIPVRSEFGEELSYCELVTAVEKSVRAVQTHQEHFMPANVQIAGIGFEYEEWPEELQSEELSWRVIMLRSDGERQKLKLKAVAQGEKLRLNFHYDGGRFAAETIARLSGQYLTLLGAVLAHPSRPLAELELLSAAERRQLLLEWQGPETTIASTSCIHELFEAQVEQRPEQTAVVYEEQQLSYAELNARANQLAHYLRELGVGPEVVVGLCLERSVEMIVGVLGILKAGGAYLPLDPRNPPARLAFMLADAGARVLLTQGELRARLALAHDQPLTVVCLDEELLFAARGKGARENLSSEVTAENLAYIIYTSGSTGQPKGVMVPHRAVVNLQTALQQAIYQQLLSGLRVSVNAPLSFDASVKQVIQLLAGHTIVLVPDELRLEAVRLVPWLREQQVAVLDCTPGQLRVLLEAGLENELQALLIGGEAIDAALWERLGGLEPTRSYNLYGPTECTVDATVSLIGGVAPTLGRPLLNTQVYVLGAEQELLPVGVAGELYLSGAGVARGYLGQAELTATRFMPHPYSVEAGARLYRTGDVGRYLEDGRIEYLGRSDRQVKLRGYRVELGEIERVVAGHEAVRECAVVAREGELGERRLVAYVVKRVADGGAGAVRYQLPNGLTIAHRNQNETAYLYEEIFAKGSYLRHGIRLPAGSCVFDVGANIGLFTLYVQQQCRDARVYAFEPVAELCATLRENSELLGGWVKVFEHGLWSAEEEVEFTYYERYTMMSGVAAYADGAAEVEVIKSYLRQEAAQGESGAGELLAQAEQLLAGRFEGRREQCRVRRLSEVIREEQVAAIELLKVDVQRAELEVLRGIEAEEWGKIRQVVMEVHDEEGGAGRCAEIRKLLEERGYGVVIEQEELLAGTDRYNLYAVQAGWDGQVARTPAAASAAVGATTARAGELREYLEQRLPEYMLPAAFVELSRLPLTRHGKVDYAALPESESSNGYLTSAYIPPENEIEQAIANIWQKVLRVDKVSCDQNFFDIGG